MTPGEELAVILATELNANIYPALTDKIKAPAVVLQPDEPWIRPGPALGTFTEQWLAIACAPAGDPVSATATIRSLLYGVIDALPAGWALRDTGRVVLDSSTGFPFMVAAARLTYAVG